MNGKMRNVNYNHQHTSRSRGSSSRENASRSKLYERYDVNIPPSSSANGRVSQRWFSNHREEKIIEARNLQDIPVEEWTNMEMIIYLYQNASFKCRMLGLLFLSMLLAVIVNTFREDDSLSSAPSRNIVDPRPNRNNFMDPDSHARSNPFAPEGHTSFMEGALEVKRVGGRKKEQEVAEQQKQQLQQQQRQKNSNNNWDPCKNHPKYILERHDHQPRHGDVCRAETRRFECPEGCQKTAGVSPFCVMEKSGGPCRVEKDPNAPPEYRCDGGTVCIMAVGTPEEQFKGEGQYFDDQCDNECITMEDEQNKQNFRCISDMDCSLAGICSPDGTCDCDPWTTGPDCSYLNFLPVDKSRLGYVNENQSSWGGSIVQGSDGKYHMYVSEILCKEEGQQRCGLNNWQTHSQIARASSINIDGPYIREEVVLPMEHHNPSVHISPKTNHWHLYSISGPTGPIVRMISNDEGRSWGIPMILSPHQNPGPFLETDGSTLLFYRADGMDLPSPTCSNEGIAVQYCPPDVNQPCAPPNDSPVFGHCGEDPSVFRDHRGNYHMLFNALPYRCVPKYEQGGHAWSSDGVTWSTDALRVGAFDTTVQFTDGTSMKCERRERPQMVLDGTIERPVALVSALTGCPEALGDGNSSGSGNGRLYRGADDSFTLVQLMNS